MSPRLLFYYIFLLLSGKALTQSISAYAAKDPKSNSHLKYYISWGCSAYNDVSAKDSLKKQGYTDITSLGYRSLNKGYYTLILGKTVNSDGSNRQTYGFGADTTKELSLKNAIQGLNGNNWSWSLKKHGYEIIEQREFESCINVNALVCVLSFSQSGVCGKSLKSFKIAKKQVTTKKIQAQGSSLIYYELKKEHDQAALLELVYFCSLDNSTSSELKFISASGEKDLELLVAQEIFNLQTSRKGLNAVNILYRSSGETVKTPDQGYMNNFIKVIGQKLKEYLEEYCRKNKCEPSKKIKNVGIGVRG